MRRHHTSEDRRCCRHFCCSREAKAVNKVKKANKDKDKIHNPAKMGNKVKKKVKESKVSNKITVRVSNKTVANKEANKEVK